MATSCCQDDHRNLDSIGSESVRGRVLVVDADHGCQRLIADVLQDEGFVPILCPSVDVALDVIKQTRPDAVVFDPWIGLERTALTVLDQVRQDTSLRAIPVIVCSVDNALLHDHADTFRCYRYPIIPKPFDVDVLLAAVHTVVTPPQRLVPVNGVALA